MPKTKIGKEVREQLGLLKKETILPEGSSGRMHGILKTKEGEFYVSVEVKDGEIKSLIERKGPDLVAVLNGYLITSLHREVNEKLLK